MKNSYLGIELGSTRIKAVLIDGNFQIIASGSHSWENRLEDGLWTYALDDVWHGIRAAYTELAAEYKALFGHELTETGGICISAMMHGYLAFDENDNLLTPFRTWRNTNTGEAAEKLSELLGFNIPLRWSVAHYYQAVRDGEEHVKNVRYLTTLAGYVHRRLTGWRVLGVGDASGMFPTDGLGFNAEMLRKFENLTGVELRGLLPKILPAGDAAGALTVEGAALLDESGALRAGIRFSPPEGDAGTGMVATNSVAPRTGNISAGTSVFAMAVLEVPLRGVYPEIDVVATPDGAPVAMVHCNSCTSDIDAWIRVFGEFAAAAGLVIDKSGLYSAFYDAALQGDADCGGLLSYNYFSGEPITGFDEGRPLFARSPDASFTFPNFARTLLCSAIATLRIGMDILAERERVRLETLTGHGGFFKTADAGQRLMAAALCTPVSVFDAAGEGGAWGAALLAAFASVRGQDESLGAFLDSRVFASTKAAICQPDTASVEGFNTFMKRYVAGLEIERTAVRELI